MLAAAFLAAAAFQAAAQAWPTRTLHLVVPYAAGGPVDLSARLVGAGLQRRLGQPVVVENRLGAGGNLASEFVARSNPDGYTLLMGAVATHAINPALYARTGYDPLRDFRHIALLVQVPNVLVVNTDLPAASVGELVALLRSRRGQVNFASGSTGSTGHLAGELFKQVTGTEMTHVPYKGSAPATADLLAGRVQLMFDNLASALPNIRAGKVRALGVTGVRRSAFLPDLPTLEEAGVPSFDLSTWWGLMGPAGMPEAAVARLADQARAVVEEPDIAEKLRAMGSEQPRTRSPAEFTAFVERELKLYAELVRRSGAKAE